MTQMDQILKKVSKCLERKPRPKKTGLNFARHLQRHFVTFFIGRDEESRIHHRHGPRATTRAHRMKIGSIVMLAVASLVQARDCDKECWNYIACMNGQTRRLHDEPEILLDDEKPLQRELDMIDVSKSLRKEQEPSNLRGNNRHLGGTNYYFNIKMHHKDDYCWQGKVKDPKFCMDCEGSKCSRGDKLLLQNCDYNDEEKDQRFVYESLGSGRGRIKPFHNQNLCLERITDRQHALQPCDDVNEVVSRRQIVLGFKWDEPFKLIAASRDDHCLTTHHYPRNTETIYASKCDDACDDDTCYWEVINLVEYGPREVVIPDGYECSSDEPCPVCYGDCDSDRHCKGNLRCYHRFNAGEDMPFCTGSEDQENSKYCLAWSYCLSRGSRMHSDLQAWRRFAFVRCRKRLLRSTKILQ